MMMMMTDEHGTPRSRDGEGRPAEARPDGWSVAAADDPAHVPPVPRPSADLLRREAALVLLEAALQCARRDATSVVVALVAVDRPTDGRGEQGVDAVVRALRDALRRELAAGDLLVRHGPDELLCTLSGVTVAEALERFTDVVRTLADEGAGAAVSIGLAVAQGDDRLPAVLLRARSDMEALTRTRGRTGVLAPVRAGSRA